MLRQSKSGSAAAPTLGQFRDLMQMLDGLDDDEECRKNGAILESSLLPPSPANAA